MFLTQVLGQPCFDRLGRETAKHATRALRPAYDQLAAQLPSQEVLGIDESPTKKRPPNLVVDVRGPRFTVYALPHHAGRHGLERTAGRDLPRCVNVIGPGCIFACPICQWCWAHSDGIFKPSSIPGMGSRKRLGQDLLRPTRKLFEVWRVPATARCPEFNSAAR